MDDNNKVICPDCQAEIVKSDLTIGDILECQERGTEVEIISTDPIKYQELIEEK